MSLKRTFFLALLASTLLSAPAWAQGDAVDQCELLAASPEDPQTPEGTGVSFNELDAWSAIDACRDAAKGDPTNPRLRFQLGRAYDVAGQYELALRNYQVALDQDYKAAAAMLGQLYEFGLGVTTDEGEAARLYEIAVEAEILSSIESLGKLYEDGRGVDQDYQRAAELYEQASAAGSHWATGALGWLTENGFGVTQDLEEAARLYQDSADNGVDFAQNNIATFYAEGLGGVTENDRKAVEYYTKAANQGFVLSYANLALHYEAGEGVKRNLGRAEEYLRKAIAEGTEAEQAQAQNNLAWMFAQENIKLDEAVELARQAVAYDEDNANNLDTLAWALHLSGQSEEALEYIERAAELSPDQAEVTEHLETIRAAVEE